MARASSIWIVFDDLGEVRAFTVKHEMITWLESQVNAPGFGQWTVRRVRDGIAAANTPSARSSHAALEFVA